MDAMSHVHTGMRVLDSDGEELGKVDELKFGDEEVITDEGQVAPGGRGGLIGGLTSALGGQPTVASQARDRLLRIGYIGIDREGFLNGHAYAEADWVQAVDNDTVRLSVPSSRLYEG